MGHLRTRKGWSLERHAVPGPGVQTRRTGVACCPGEAWKRVGSVLKFLAVGKSAGGAACRPQVTFDL
jgi:hypothetical protein